MKRKYAYAIVVLYVCLIALIFAGDLSTRFLVNDKIASTDVLFNNGRYYVAIDDLAKALNATTTTTTKPGQGTTINLLLSKSAIAEDVGTIKGVITYYFNFNFGNKPDVGASVTLIEGEVKIPATHQFLGGSGKAYITDVPAVKAAIDQGNDPKKGVEKFITSYKVIQHATANGDGSYEMNDVPVGRYSVVIQSAHREDDKNRRDMVGLVHVNIIDVRGGQVEDASYNFYPSGDK